MWELHQMCYKPEQIVRWTLTLKEIRLQVLLW